MMKFQLTAQGISEIASLDEGVDLKLIYKWGFDDCTNRSQCTNDGSSTDEYFFLIAMVPLKLMDKRTAKIVWANPRLSSELGTACKNWRIQRGRKRVDIFVKSLYFILYFEK